MTKKYIIKTEWEKEPQRVFQIFHFILGIICLMYLSDSITRFINATTHFSIVAYFLFAAFFLIATIISFIIIISSRGKGKHYIAEEKK